MILGAPCAHRAPGVGDFPWGPRRLVAVPVAPPAPRRGPCGLKSWPGDGRVKADAPPRSAAGGSSSSERPSGRRVRGLCHSPASRCPLSETTSPHSVAGKCPSCTRGSGAAPPHTHTCVAADPGTPRPPVAPRSPRLCPRRRPAARGRVGVPRGNGGHVLAAVGRAAVGLRRQRGAHVRAWAWVRGWGRRRGRAGRWGAVRGGPRPLCPLRSCRQPSGPPQRHRNGAPRAGGRAPACTFAGHRHQACDGRGHLPLVGTARGQDRLSHRLGPGAGAEALAADRSWGHVHSL